MDLSSSRSEQKRQAKNIETLAFELAELSTADIKKLPCHEELKQEIAMAKTFTGGARKRQLKHVAKGLRDVDPAPIYDFLTEKKGSRLRQARDFHELEQLREQIISEALQAGRQAQEQEEQLHENWQSTVAETARRQFPSLDIVAVNRAAVRYARTRKPVYRREIFRQLKASQDRLQFQTQPETKSTAGDGGRLEEPWNTEPGQ